MRSRTTVPPAENGRVDAPRKGRPALRLLITNADDPDGSEQAQTESSEAQQGEDELRKRLDDARKRLQELPPMWRKRLRLAEVG